MSDHTPAQLAHILAPLWEAVPEARPKDQSGRVLALADYGVWAFCTTAMHADCVVVVDEVVARDLIIARLQMALDARACVIYKPGALAAHWGDGTYIEIDVSDPIIARAQLLAKIVGVELGEV
jgi:hypothetical protein